VIALQYPSGGIPADSLRQVLDSVFAQPMYQWARPSPFAILGKWWRALLAWLAGLESTRPGLYWFLFYLMLALLLAILLHAAIVFARTVRASHRLSEAGPAPAARTRGSGWYRAEALRLAAAGRYPEAMQHDFLGLVLELDQQRLLKYHPSKTPGEYTREVQLTEAGRGAFRDLVGSLYRFAFARVPCAPGDFAAWQRDARPERYAAAH
jgi:hypothetical protein